MLTLPIKKKWFDMIQSGKKMEEYRDIKPYWTKRFQKLGLLDEYGNPTIFLNIVRFRNGYSAKSPFFDAVVRLSVHCGYEEWGAKPGISYYVLNIEQIYYDMTGG
jgi:acetyltransferase-like isoleucine patch superfamily enzyme